MPAEPLCPTRYDVTQDKLVWVTQEWVDSVTAKLVEMHNALKDCEASSHDGGGRAQSELREKSRNSAESSKGIQQGRSGEAKAPREVAVAWACTVDGWVQVPARAIRNPESPHLVWMLKSTWDMLASHADIRGLFFIPCETAPDAQHLRMLVNAKEIADAS